MSVELYVLTAALAICFFRVARLSKRLKDVETRLELTIKNPIMAKRQLIKSKVKK